MTVTPYVVALTSSLLSCNKYAGWPLEVIWKTCPKSMLICKKKIKIQKNMLKLNHFCNLTVWMGIRHAMCIWLLLLHRFNTKALWIYEFIFDYTNTKCSLKLNINRREIKVWNINKILYCHSPANHPTHTQKFRW